MNENQNFQNNYQGLNNSTNFNQVNNSVPPINEIKVENNGINLNTSTVSSPEVNNNLNNNVPNNEPPKSSNKSTILLILLFVFLFAFIMGMPYINEFIDQFKADTGLSEIEKQAKEEEEKQKQEAENNKTQQADKEKMTEVVCTSGTSPMGNYTLVQIQKFEYNSKKQIVSSKNISKYTFTVVDDTYNNLKRQCDEDSLKYLTHSGYTMACSYDNSNIEISHEFDLELFTPIINGGTSISANATYKQNIDEVKNNLISQGYTCQ